MPNGTSMLGRHHSLAPTRIAVWFPSTRTIQHHCTGSATSIASRVAISFERHQKPGNNWVNGHVSL